MAVYDTSKRLNVSSWISKTPPNEVADNYFLSELQQKVNSDWKYRPNRVIVERETEHGSEVYNPLEVVLQTVKNDKGEDIAENWKRVVFKNIHEPVRIGKKYRFNETFDINADDKDKDVWIALNQDFYNLTSSQVICKCETTLGSIYTDEDGQTHYHYEPVVQPDDLASYSVRFNQVAMSENGAATYIAQYNKFTAQYYINQRFIMGPITKKRVMENGEVKEYPVAHVYKIANLYEIEQSSTYDNDDPELLKIYFEEDQQSDQDDLTNRIAYNGLMPAPNPEETSGDYEIRIVEPKLMPTALADDILMKPQIYYNGSVSSETIVADELTLGGSTYASKAKPETFATLTDNGDGTWTLHKLKSELTFTICGGFRGTGDLNDLCVSFEFKLYGG